MGYFRSLTDSSFKIDHSGNTVFYPWGILGKGYLLPDKKTEEKIRTFIIWYYVVGLTFLFVGIFLSLLIVAAIILIPIAAVIWCLATMHYIRGLKQSEERLSFKEHFKKLFGNGSS